MQFLVDKLVGRWGKCMPEYIYIHTCTHIHHVNVHIHMNTLTHSVSLSHAHTHAHTHLTALFTVSTSSLRNWDIAQLVPVDRVSPSETFDGFVKAMRVLFYIFLFIVIIVSGSVSIVSLLWLVQFTKDRVPASGGNQTEACFILCF